AADGEAEPDGAGGLDAIENRLDAELLGIDAAFLVGEGLARKGGGELVIVSDIRKQIFGELFDRKLIERKIAVDGVDDPVAIFPGVEALGIFFITVRVGVAGLVEPVAAEALAEMGVGEEAVDQLCVGAIRWIGGETIGFIKRRRETNKIVIEALDEGVRIRSEERRVGKESRCEDGRQE